MPGPTRLVALLLIAQLSIAPALVGAQTADAPAGSSQTPTLAEVRAIAESGRFGEAQRALDRFLETSPDDVEARLLVGVLLAQQGRAEDAIASFQALAQAEPELAEPHNNLAVLHAARGEYDAARRALLAAIAIEPRYPTAHENLGDIYAKLASLSYQRAYELDPGDEVAREKSIMSADTYELAEARRRSQPGRQAGESGPASRVGAGPAPTVAAESAEAPPEPASDGATATATATASDAEPAAEAPGAGSETAAAPSTAAPSTAAPSTAAPSAAGPDANQSASTGSAAESATQAVAQAATGSAPISGADSPAAESTAPSAEPGVVRAAPALPTEAPSAAGEDGAAAAPAIATAPKTGGAAATATGPRSCFRVDGLASAKEGDDMVAWFAARGVYARTRTDSVDEVWGHRVYVPPLPRRDAARALIQSLKRSGISDVARIPNGRLQNGVSLGVYSRRENAQRRVRRVRSAGYPAEIEPMTRAGTALWLELVTLDPASEAAGSQAEGFAAAFPDRRMTRGECAAG